MTESERFKKIHDEIFAKSYKDTLYVFLCGGATIVSEIIYECI